MAPRLLRNLFVAPRVKAQLGLRAPRGGVILLVRLKRTFPSCGKLEHFTYNHSTFVQQTRQGSPHCLIARHSEPPISEPEGGEQTIQQRRADKGQEEQLPVPRVHPTLAENWSISRTTIPRSFNKPDNVRLTA